MIKASVCIESDIDQCNVEGTTDCVENNMELHGGTAQARQGQQQGATGYVYDDGATGGVLECAEPYVEIHVLWLSSSSSMLYADQSGRDVSRGEAPSWALVVLVSRSGACDSSEESYKYCDLIIMK